MLGESEAETAVGFEGGDGFFNHIGEIVLAGLAELGVVGGHQTGEGGELAVGDVIFEAVVAGGGALKAAVAPFGERGDGRFVSGGLLVNQGAEFTGEQVGGALNGAGDGFFGGELDQVGK